MGDISKLIHLVRQNPILYDTSHFEYGQTKTKSDIWEIIAVDANFPTGNAAKVEWESLRNRHREALRRQKNRIISNFGGAIKLWQYQTEMQFLLPYMKNNRSSVINFEFPSSNGTTNNPYEDAEEEDSADCVVDDYELKHEVKRLKLSQNMPSETVNSSNKNMNASLDRNKHQRSMFTRKHKLEDDALYLFFISMYNTTKEMPKHIQCSIKRKCSTLVFEEEEKLLNEMMTQSTAFTNSLQSSPRSTESPGLSSVNDRNQTNNTQLASPEHSVSEDIVQTSNAVSSGNNKLNAATNSFENSFPAFVEKYEPY